MCEMQQAVVVHYTVYVIIFSPSSSVIVTVAALTPRLTPVVPDAN